MDLIPIKMFGLQRTCTNVALKGLKRNFLVDSQEKGREWKHGPIGQAGLDGLRIICCFRNPWAWLVSMYRWSFSGDRDGCPHFHTNWSFPEFLVRQHYDFPNPLVRWNVLNRHYLDWLSEHPSQGVLLRSEDMMGPDEAKLQYERIGRHFSLEFKDPRVVHVFKRRVNNVQSLGKPMDFDYYRQCRYLHEYDAPSLQFISKYVDSQVLEQLHYDKPA